MKSWQRNFILGIIIGTISVIIMRALVNSVPGYDNDSNLLIVLFGIIAYGAGTMILGEILMFFGRNK